MNNKSNILVTILFVISVSLLSTMLTVLCLSKYYSNAQFLTLNSLCQIFVDEALLEPNTLMETLKVNKENLISSDSKNLLEQFGYKAVDFIDKQWKLGNLISAVCLGVSILIFLFTFLYWHNKQCKQSRRLTEYLEKMNIGEQGLLFSTEESDHSRLQDEIYKTVTTLYQTKDAALSAKNNFADNLYNIAHQLKTPITAISLSAQIIEEKFDLDYARQIQKQITRLTHLEEALLLLSRIDAGTLVLEPTKLDVFTILNLAADNLQELSSLSNITIDIPEMGEAELTADREWTMEAIMNLLKNCMEHSKKDSIVHCSYEKNPLYIQIRIWDEGDGFDKEDIPHIFERFYRGKNAVKGSIGIGLAFSKAIIEMQNGIINGGNLPEGGAFFEIRMYSH